MYHLMYILKPLLYVAYNGDVLIRNIVHQELSQYKACHLQWRNKPIGCTNTYVDTWCGWVQTLLWKRGVWREWRARHRKQITEHTTSTCRNRTHTSIQWQSTSWQTGQLLYSTSWQTGQLLYSTSWQTGQLLYSTSWQTGQLLYSTSWQTRVLDFHQHMFKLLTLSV